MTEHSFTKTKVSSMTLGEKLRELRIDRDSDQAHVSQQTKIPLKYVQYLEDGTYDQLPAAVYVKGFLRSYARFLRVPEKSLIRLYEREAGVHETLSQPKKTKSIRYTENTSHSFFSRIVITRKMIIIALSLLLVLGGIIYLVQEVNRFVSEPLLLITAPQDGSQIDERTTTLTGQTDRTGQVFVNGQEVHHDENGNFSTDLNLIGGTNTITVRAQNRFGTTTEQSLVIHTPQDDIPQLEEQPEEAPPEDIILVLRTEDKPVWITVSADGESVYSKKMPANSSEEFITKGQFVVTAGIGNAVFATLNGEDQGTLGDTAEVIRDVVFGTPLPEVEAEDSDSEEESILEEKEENSEEGEDEP